MVLVWKTLHAQVNILRFASPCATETRPHRLRSTAARSLVTKGHLENSPSEVPKAGSGFKSASVRMGAQKPKTPVDPSIAKNLLEFINASWTPYHAVGVIPVKIDIVSAKIVPIGFLCTIMPMRGQSCAGPFISVDGHYRTHLSSSDICTEQAVTLVTMNG